MPIGCCRSTRASVRPRRRQASAPATRRRSQCSPHLARRRATAGLGRRRLRRLPRPDRAAQLLGACGGAQHRVPGRRRARHGDERADLGVQRGARARDDHRAADRRDAPPVRSCGCRTAGRLRGASARGHLRRRRRCSDAVLRGERPPRRAGASTPGHAIGLRNHEAPFLDLGDHTPSSPAWCSRSSQALYSPTVGGFRHSDTVVVTEDGIEILTEYPRDIESLTLPR